MRKANVFIYPTPWSLCYHCTRLPCMLLAKEYLTSENDCFALRGAFPIFRCAPECDKACVHLHKPIEKLGPPKCTVVSWQSSEVWIVMNQTVTHLFFVHVYNFYVIQELPPEVDLRLLFSVFNETPENWVVMPQIASFHDSAHLWHLNDKSSKILIYATWSKVRKRHTKPNLLFENSVSKCLLGQKGKKAKPRGHGELTVNFLLLCFLCWCIVIIYYYY